MDAHPVPQPALSVILPALDCADQLPDSIERIAASLSPLVRSLEFIVVDDGSRDDTRTRMAAFAAEVAGHIDFARRIDLRLLCNRRRLGKGHALRLGVFAARHPKLLVCDADAPFSDASYRRVALPLLREAPVVIGSRRLPDSQLLIRLSALSYASRRHMIGIVFNRLVRACTGLPFRDTQCGLKGFDTKLANALFGCVHRGGFLFDIEVLLAAHLRRVDVEQVPVCVEYEDTRSSVSVALDALRMAGGLLEISGRHRSRPPAPDLDATSFAALTEEVGLGTT